MLIKCDECSKQVSDKALYCPHCGYPINQKAIRNIKSTRRTRLPNGFGQITKLKNKALTKPYRAMVTTGKDEYGKPICKLLKPESYFKSYNEAYKALVEYNKNPYELNNNITMNELFNRWFDVYKSKELSKSRYGIIKSVWTYCKSVYNIPVILIRGKHIKYCIEYGTVIKNGKEKKLTSSMQEVAKQLFNMLLDYALEFELIDKNYSKNINLSNLTNVKEYTVANKHIVFSDEELKVLWDNTNLDFVDLILVQCYTGFRPSELLNIELKNVDIENGIIIGGSKTDAGKNRPVPIHPKIEHIIRHYYENSKKNNKHFLFTYKNKSISYMVYRKHFSEIINALDLNLNHKLHDGRKTFVTLAKRYNLNEYAIKYIVGHAISDLTEKVYTERNILWLVSEMKKIE